MCSPYTCRRAPRLYAFFPPSPASPHLPLVTLYLQSSPPVTMLPVIAFQSALSTTPSCAFQLSCVLLVLALLLPALALLLLPRGTAMMLGPAAPAAAGPLAAPCSERMLTLLPLQTSSWLPALPPHARQYTGSSAAMRVERSMPARDHTLTWPSSPPVAMALPAPHTRGCVKHVEVLVWGAARRSSESEAGWL